ncbi:hypothetical protein HAX54_014925, partial [Datura stramonium]|nr:hypothetical protein [Datura stramonium]
TVQFNSYNELPAEARRLMNIDKQQIPQLRRRGSSNGSFAIVERRGGEGNLAGSDKFV